MSISGTFDNINVGRTVLNSSSVLNINGNTSIQEGSYLSFGTVDSISGYGIRDNSGSLEFKNSTGNW
jgi:hypothetical protein